ncbi:MAG TPA: class I SAM-dependent methyltransferase [Candidatus Binataceae bacterium]
MNLLHRWLCSSDRWKATLETRALPWTLEDVELGSEVLEVGPGPGLTTDLLCGRVAHLTCVEIDQGFSDSLAQRMKGKNVTVLHGDATAMSFPAAAFDSAVSFTMLHHVQSAALQDRLFAEVARVLRPAGVFAGMDSVYSKSLRLLHVFDTMVLVDPATLPGRLESAGFTDVSVDTNPYAFRFRARRRA